MKSKVSIVFIALFAIFVTSLSAQENCKVLVPELNGIYTGKCKKGLAHGSGRAEGVDVYEGKFRKGIPNGYGTYTWANGNFYEGRWISGQRDGEGAYKFRINGHDSIQAGVWSKDVYLGPKPQSPKVFYKEFITSYSIKRNGEGDRILIDLRLNGQANRDILDFSLISSSGAYFEAGRSHGLETIVFPVNVKLKYQSWNAAHSSRHDVTFEFEIFEKGNWQVVINN